MDAETLERVSVSSSSLEEESSSSSLEDEELLDTTSSSWAAGAGAGLRVSNVTRRPGLTIASLEGRRGAATGAPPTAGRFDETVDALSILMLLLLLVAAVELVAVVVVVVVVLVVLVAVVDVPVALVVFVVALLRVVVDSESLELSVSSLAILKSKSTFFSLLLFEFGPLPGFVM